MEKKYAPGKYIKLLYILFLVQNAERKKCGCSEINSGQLRNDEK